MKKSVALFLTLAMLATLFCGIVPVSAATGDATVTAGGTYADAVWDDEIVFKTNTANDWVVVDSTEKTLTITKTAVDGGNNFNPGGNIDLSGVNWKKTGKITLTYEATITDVSSEEVRIGFVPRVTTTVGTNKQVTNSNGTIDEQCNQCSFNNVPANTKIYAKTVYSFTATGITGTTYSKTDASSEYIKKGTFTYSATIAADNFKFTALEPYGRTWYSNQEGADNTFSVMLSNIVLTESYDDAQLQSFSNTHYADESLDINFRLPEGYTSASLSIGGNKIADMKASDKPAGGYVATADVSSLDWYGNMKAVLDIDINDGTSKKLSSDIKIVNGPDKTSYGLEDFEDENHYYEKSDEIEYETIEGKGSVAGITKVNSEASEEGWDGKTIASDYRSGNNYILLELDSNSYVSGNSCVEIDFDMYMEDASSLAGVYVKTNQDNTINEVKYDQTFWDWIYGYGCSNGIETQKNEWSTYVGDWKHVKFVADLEDDLIYIYVDGNYVKSATFGTDNDQKKDGDVTYNSDNYENPRKLETIKHIGLCLKTTDYDKVSTSIYVDNVEFKSYVKGDKPAIDSISVGEGNAISVKFDKAVTVGENAITLKCGGSNIASSVAYDEATLTATITPSDTLTALNGTVEIADSVAGYAMSVPVDFAVDMPFITNAKLENKGDGRYEGTVDVYNDKAEEKLGAVYVAVYNGTALEGVAKAVINSVDGKTTITCPLTLSDASSASSTYTAKMFVWNNALKPILDVVK